MANRTRTELSTDALSYFPNNNSQLITPQDLRDWLTNGIESFVTQKDTSKFQNAFYENKGSNIIAASTTNLSLASGNFIHIQGTTEINSFGTLDSGARFILMFEDAANLRASANLIIPGTTSGNLRVATPGDCCLIVSEGGGAWRIVGYFVAGGAGAGTITGVTAGTGLTGGGTSGVVTLNLANTSVTPAAYTNANITVDAQGRITSAANGSGITDGDKGDITVSGSGSTWTVDANAITYGKIQNASGSSLLLGSNASGTGITEITLGSNLTMTGSTLNASGGGGGTPGGNQGEIQYNNANAFYGVPDLTYEGTPTPFVVIKNPKIGQSTGNGHLHIHSANSAPTGITDYLTMWWEKATRVLGFRSETDANETYIQITAPTADRTITIPDATGNVVIDTTIPSFSNGASAGEIRLKEAGGSDYIGLKSPSSIGTPITYTLPGSDGSSGYALITNGSAVLSWANVLPINPSKFLRTNIQASITNQLVDTFMQSLLIPANTFASGDAFNVFFTVHIASGSTGSNTGTSLRINTTNLLSGSILISGATSNVEGSGVTWPIYSNRIHIDTISGSTQTRSGTITNVAGPVTTNLIDWTQTQYLIVSGNVQTRTKTFLSLYIQPLC